MYIVGAHIFLSCSNFVTFLNLHFSIAARSLPSIFFVIVLLLTSIQSYFLLLFLPSFDKDELTILLTFFYCPLGMVIRFKLFVINSYNIPQKSHFHAFSPFSIALFIFLVLFIRCIIYNIV